MWLEIQLLKYNFMFVTECNYAKMYNFSPHVANDAWALDDEYLMTIEVTDQNNKWNDRQCFNPLFCRILFPAKYIDDLTND